VTDLRTLAQAVVDARAAWLAVADAAPSRARAVDSDEWRAMLTAEGNLSALARGRVVHSVSLLLAALDAERAQGYARAMGEVDSLLQQRVQAHRDAMLDRMPQYAHDIRQGAREEATEIREWLSRRLLAEARIERVGAILSDEGCDCYCDCDSDGHNADCDLCLACRIDREVSP
jgi:hypothetical protein